MLTGPSNGGTSVEVAGRTLSWQADGRFLLDGELLQLAPASLLVLRALLEHPGSPVSRHALLEVLPGAASLHAVDLAVARLRSSIGPALVQSVAQHGYRLAVPGQSPRD